MRKAILVIVAVALSFTAGQKVGAYTLRRVYNYYTDSTFSTACGWYDTSCGTIQTDGCSTNYRYAEIYNCETGDQTSAHCQEWNGSSWVDVSCPDESVTIESRVHIVVG